MTTAEIIRPIIRATYGENAMADSLASYLATAIDTWRPRYSGDERYRMIQNFIWINMPGGDTAAACAHEIEEALSDNEQRP